MTTRKKTTRKKATKKKTAKKTARRRAASELDKPLPDTNWPWPLRDRQQAAWNALEGGQQQQLLAWHRRYGKDIYGLSVARNRVRQRVASYVHFLPKTVQARRALWNGVDPNTGKRFIDTAFGDLIVNINNQDMFLELYNGSTWQLLGSDNYDRFVGSAAAGVIYSEWALCDPRARDFLRPILVQAAKHGPVYEIYISTFRGRNHMWQMYQNLKNNPDWYVDLAGVDVTTNLDGSPVITPDDIEKERRDGMSEALIQQEYYCNPQATADGAIYGNQVDALRMDANRNGAFWHPDKPVYCVWNFDLPVFGAYILAQPGDDAQRPRILDCGILEFEDLATMLAQVNEQRFPIQEHILGSHNRDVISAFFDLGKRAQLVNMPSPYYVHESTSNLLNICQIDGQKCDLLLDALSGYIRRERFDSQAHDLQFSGDAVMSWHWRLALALETFAAGDYHSSNEWSTPADYSVQDRIYRLT